MAVCSGNPMPPDAVELRFLLDRYERPLIRYTQSITGDLESARDVVQEAFIQLVEGRGPAPTEGTDSRRHTEAWLFTVCRNRAIDYQRKQSRIIPMNAFDDARRSEEPGPADALESRELACSLLHLMESLPANQREVIRLKFQNDLSYKEIAGITQLSVTNVGFLLHTGLKKMRLLLSEAPEHALPLRHTL
ncbi:MAG: polymerase, sigma-24 subunit, subfamily [Chthoniobacteraceae bacterium]|nr:polymerase, sigma-24 subunit, subfamily [Chthoniobacteraceae bacterium]